MIFFDDNVTDKLTTRFEQCSQEQLNELRFSAESILSEYGKNPYCTRILVCSDESGLFFLYEILIFKDNLSMFIYIDSAGKDLFIDVITI